METTIAVANAGVKDTNLIAKMAGAGMKREEDNEDVYQRGEMFKDMDGRKSKRAKKIMEVKKEQTSSDEE